MSITTAIKEKILSKQKRQFVRGNEALPSPGSQENVSREEFMRRMLELKRCKEDPIYFADHYYTIISLSGGEQIIRMYEKQKNLLNFLVDNDRVCLLASRQTGKSFSGESTIKVRNKKTGEIIEIAADDFYKMNKN